MSSELTRLRRLIHYDGWANAAALESLHGLDHPRARAWMAHIIAAGSLWLRRIREEPPAMPVWPDLDLERCASELARLRADWDAYLDAVSDADLDDGVGYRNSKGEFWTSTVSDILLHVVTHSAYHRGQIAAAVREAGGTPAYTDFAHAVRQGLVE